MAEGGEDEDVLSLAGLTLMESNTDPLQTLTRWTEPTAQPGKIPHRFFEILRKLTTFTKFCVV